MIITKKGGKFKFFPDQTLLDLRIFICSTTYRNGPWVGANNTLGHDRTNSILNIRKKQGENAKMKFIKKYIEKKKKKFVKTLTLKVEALKNN